MAFVGFERSGYSTVKGTKQTADELWELFCGLELNDLLSYTHVLTGTTHHLFPLSPFVFLAWIQTFFLLICSFVRIRGQC